MHSDVEVGNMSVTSFIEKDVVGFKVTRRQDHERQVHQAATTRDAPMDDFFLM